MIDMTSILMTLFVVLEDVWIVSNIKDEHE